MKLYSRSLTKPTANIQIIYQRLNPEPEAIANFCKRWQITELSVFGSILREDFRAEGIDPSDVDFLYVSEPKARYGFRFFDMQTELGQLVGRGVDLISKRGIQKSLNPLRRRAILESARVIYAERSSVDS